jgi:hypothetical protein
VPKLEDVQEVVLMVPELMYGLEVVSIVPSLLHVLEVAQTLRKGLVPPWSLEEDELRPCRTPAQDRARATSQG